MMTKMTKWKKGAKLILIFRRSEITNWHEIVNWKTTAFQRQGQKADFYAQVYGVAVSDGSFLGVVGNYFPKAEARVEPGARGSQPLHSYSKYPEMGSGSVRALGCAVAHCVAPEECSSHHGPYLPPQIPLKTQHFDGDQTLGGAAHCSVGQQSYSARVEKQRSFCKEIRLGGGLHSLWI